MSLFIQHFFTDRHTGEIIAQYDVRRVSNRVSYYKDYKRISKAQIATDLCVDDFVAGIIKSNNAELLMGLYFLVPFKKCDHTIVITEDNGNCYSFGQTDATLNGNGHIGKFKFFCTPEGKHITNGREACKLIDRHYFRSVMTAFAGQFFAC